MVDKNDRDALNALDSRLKNARDHVQDPLNQPGAEKAEKGGALGLAFRVSVEIVSAVAIGVGIGWLLDGWLETTPWLMVVFIVLGFAAGILNVYRLATGFGYAAGYTDRDEQAGDKAGTDEGN
ncbi:MAG: AtpZ/AtpI family protein [Alphaproteobacteria bacterium]|nr:AtpZ/AtpI family protein [Alphaproteobacteria bacterium]